MAGGPGCGIKVARNAEAGPDIRAVVIRLWRSPETPRVANAPDIAPTDRILLIAGQPLPISHGKVNGLRRAISMVMSYHEN